MDTIIELFTYDFFVNAFVASLLAAISCGIVGAYIVSRRIVFISGGITHASFGGIGMGYYLGINPLFGAGIFAILSGMGIQLFSSKGKVREDSSIAIWWSLGMAIGIIFVLYDSGICAQSHELFVWKHPDRFIRRNQTDAGACHYYYPVFHTFLSHHSLYYSFDEDFARTSQSTGEFVQLFTDDPDFADHCPEHPGGWNYPDFIAPHPFRRPQPMCLPVNLAG